MERRDEEEGEEGVFIPTFRGKFFHPVWGFSPKNLPFRWSLPFTKQKFSRQNQSRDIPLGRVF